MTRWPSRRAARAALVLAVLAVLPTCHALVVASTGLRPPSVAIPPDAGVHAWTRVRAGLRLVYLEGSPEAIGAAHARLLRERMVADETEIQSEYERHVPWWAVRTAIEDFSRVRYRHIAEGIPDARRREIAAEALAFKPDPYASHMPTYQRMVFLYSLYDIALPLEHSPLVGCTSFALAPRDTADGHVLFGRAFDFEAGEVFDRDKAVFLVREEGAVPFASVAWPGFVGVVTGMNAEGVVMVVHGARGRRPVTDGIPVAFSLREALSHAHDTREAVQVLAAQRVLVSHIVFVADASGHFAVVERAPAEPAFVRETEESTAVTNHFEGPLASDPRNLRVRDTTTTLARRARADERLGEITPGSATPASALAILRDHGCAAGPCALGDRRAIDALIATHGIIADATAKTLWVSAGPRLSGPFVRLDLHDLLSAKHDPDSDRAPETMPADPTVAGREAP
ncbi:MAG TPA: C45 family peptidase [Polyangiaceae bacterium]|nr:C45 family peptidase [Polyangiaceae bacterium]